MPAKMAWKQSPEPLTTYFRGDCSLAVSGERIPFRIKSFLDGTVCEVMRFRMRQEKGRAILRSEAYLFGSIHHVAIREMLSPYQARGTEAVETKGPARTERDDASLTWLSSCADFNVLIKWTF